MTQLIHLDGNSLTLEEVIAVARHGAQCELDEAAKEAVIASRKIVDDIVREKRVVYGVTTGFGSLPTHLVLVIHFQKMPFVLSCSSGSTRS